MTAHEPASADAVSLGSAPPVVLSGGEFEMGSARFYPEERPVHRVTVAPFAIDRFPVTNAQFAAFVAATGYRTVAERPLDPADYPGADPESLVPGGLVFQQAPHRIPLHDFTRWWAYVPGANWRHPRGPDTTIVDLVDHPCVQVAYADAVAYAQWRGARLPTEAEWEFAARGGLDQATFAWGEETDDGAPYRTNRWRGEFPWQNLRSDGFEYTSPVGSFPANGHGLHDMTGNVWEWTSDWWRAGHCLGATSCCGPDVAARRSAAAGETIPRRVIKGGSHLCAPNYCLRYRPAARQPEAVDTATCHLGFRCVVDG
ncbi:formylglycine-generating enzyme family protein [Nocardia sp. NPDC051833]|uniref:formylglycine-generating enzyme family protein n=1 Tax=Nocardia sp. NPDC051833 TaxID=3155674 RepID=UPI003414F7D6